MHRVTYVQEWFYYEHNSDHIVHNRLTPPANHHIAFSIQKNNILLYEKYGIKNWEN